MVRIMIFETRFVIMARRVGGFRRTTGLGEAVSLNAAELYPIVVGAGPEVPTACPRGLPSGLERYC